MILGRRRSLFFSPRGAVIALHQRAREAREFNKIVPEISIFDVFISIHFKWYFFCKKYFIKQPLSKKIARALPHPQPQPPQPPSDVAWQSFKLM